MMIDFKRVLTLASVADRVANKRSIAVDACLNETFPKGKPLGNFARSFQWRQRQALEPIFTVNQHAFMVTKVAEFVWFDFVFLDFGIINTAFPGA